MLEKIAILRQLDVLNYLATLCCPVILWFTFKHLFPHSAYIINLLERQLQIYHDTTVQDGVAKPTSINIIPCPLKCHVGYHVPVLFLCICLMLMHFCPSLIWCNSWQMGWMRVVPLGCLPPALPTQQLEQRLWRQDFVPRSWVNQALLCAGPYLTLREKENLLKELHNISLKTSGCGDRPPASAAAWLPRGCNFTPERYFCTVAYSYNSGCQKHPYAQQCKNIKKISVSQRLQSGLVILNHEMRQSWQPVIGRLVLDYS